VGFFDPGVRCFGTWFFPALERYLRDCRDDPADTPKPQKRVVGQVVEYMKREDNVDDKVEKLAFEVEKLKKNLRWVNFRLALPRGHPDRWGYVITFKRLRPGPLPQAISERVEHLSDKQLNRQWWDLTRRIHRKEQRAKALVRDVQIRRHRLALQLAGRPRVQDVGNGSKGESNGRVAQAHRVQDGQADDVHGALPVPGEDGAPVPDHGEDSPDSHGAVHERDLPHVPHL